MENTNGPTAITVGDLSYQVYKLPPRKSVPIITKILKIVSPLLAEGYKKDLDPANIANSILDAEIDLSKVISIIVDKIGDDDVYNLMAQCFSSVQHKGAILAEIMEAHFMGKELHMFQVFAKVLEVNFGNFFGVKRADTFQEDLKEQGLRSSKAK